MNAEPRLSKLPFFIADAVLLIVAAIIAKLSANPFAPLPFVTCVALVVIGIIVLLVPFLTDYGAALREATARVQDELEQQVKRVQAAAEVLGRASAQIKAIEEAVQKSARDAETLPYRMQEKLAEFNQALAAKENDETEALERELEELRATNSDQLKAVAEKIAKAATDWSALEVANRRQLGTAQDAAAKLESRLATAVAQLDSRIAELSRVAMPAPPPAPLFDAPSVTVAEKPFTAPAIEATSETPAPAGPASEVVPAAPALNGEAHSGEPAKVRKPRAPRKPKPEEVLMTMSAETPAAGAEQEVSAASVAVEDIPASVPAEASASSDGATRLLATAYIGIGNKLFIRGDGPGLSWEKGVPMQFVSIGKWGWSTHDAAGAVNVKLYKNDETAALSGPLTIEPGRHTEITALF